MINLLHDQIWGTLYTEDECVAGEPVVKGGAIVGIASVDKTEPAAKVPTNLAVSYAGAGGYWPLAQQALYAVTSVDVNGKESLPAFIWTTAGAVDDIVELDWDDMAGAVEYRVYRGLSWDGVSPAATPDAFYDPILLTTVTVSECDDNGYEFTARAAPGSETFEDVIIKGSSMRPPDSRDPDTTRVLQEQILNVLLMGVVYYEPVDNATNGIASMVDGVQVQYDTANGKITTQAAGGTRIALGKVTSAYAAKFNGKRNVAVAVNL